MPDDPIPTFTHDNALLLHQALPQMKTEFAAEILAVSAAGLARLASERVLPQLRDAAGYGDDPAADWRQHLEARVHDLSLAMADSRPEQFGNQIGWSKLAATSRGTPVEDLESGLRCLRDVLVEELPDDVGAMCLTYLDAVLAGWADLGELEASELDADAPEGRLGMHYIRALLEGDRVGACNTVLDAVRGGQLDVTDALTKVCLPVQRELGRMWQADEITVAEEHFVSATTVQLMGQLRSLATPAAPNGKTVVAATIEGDDHDIGTRAIADLFELNGWRTVFLGANLPVDDLMWAARTFKADLLVLSGMLPVHARTIGQAVQRLHAEYGRDAAPRVLVGGSVFTTQPELFEQVGADATAATAERAVAAGRKLIGLAP